MRILDSKHLVFVPGLLSTEELWREVREDLKEDLNCRVTQQNLRQSSCEEMADVVGGNRFRVQLKALLESQSLEEKLSKIQCDTLVIAAESDCLVSPQESQLIIQLIYSSTLVLVKDAAHLATLDRPKTISELLRQWLTGVLEIDKGQVTI